jgi:hypothetical protein
VLSNLSEIQTAAGWRAEGSAAALDAGRPSLAPVTMLRGTNTCRAGALATMRPRTGKGIFVPATSQLPGQTSASGKQDTGKKYQHASRMTAVGGNAPGSHPASWDPV